MPAATSLGIKPRKSFASEVMGAETLCIFCGGGFNVDLGQLIGFKQANQLYQQRFYDTGYYKCDDQQQNGNQNIREGVNDTNEKTLIVSNMVQNSS